MTEQEEIAALRQANAKLMASNQELMNEQKSGRVVSRSQYDEFQRIVREHVTLNDEVNNVVMFLRENVPQFRDGRYTGLSFSQFVINILKRPRLFGRFW